MVPDPGPAQGWPKLGLIAGGGTLPGQVISACQAEGRPLHVLALKGHADPAVIGDFPADWIRMGEAGSGIALLKKAGVKEIVMIGPVRRPTLSELTPDFKTAAFFARIGLKALGDDGLLRSVIAELESEGFKVKGLHDVLADCLVPPGFLGTVRPDAQAQSDIIRGVEVAKAVGDLDVGQAVVVQQGIILGVEAVEGTDALLKRCVDLKRSGPGGVLVKLKKPNQDNRADLPTIGLVTLHEANKAGLRGIVVEALGALVIDPASVAVEADRLGMFIEARVTP